MPLYTVIAVFLLAFSANSYAGDLFDMLQRMSDADQNQNYQGIFILRKSDKLSTLKVLHGNDEEGVWERLETLDGESRQVIRRNNKIVSIYPGRKLVTIRHRANNHSLHLQLPDNIKQLDNFYTLQRLDDDRIADHPTLVVDLLPKDQYRYGYRYWVDKNTGMLLRCDLLAVDNTVVEQMMFASLKYLKSSPEDLFEIAPIEQYKRQVLDAHEFNVLPSTQLKWAVKVLPKGFMLTQSMTRHPSPSATNKSVTADLLHLVYSDGLASVSIFIEENQGEDKHLQGASTMGAVNAYGNSVGDHFVTVVGEVPITTVQSMARSTVRLQ
ncbi:Sigma factor RpoE negative regulatory protein RseB precursor [hydrothermal vent metagenome]|uniref:Sigma factor RpoE negative regulatory protein RseB n=1 Tax=hydrothermal vent metagenome TaxID=652676 RepID=A0A3B0X1R8_9ZZZZ